MYQATPFSWSYAAFLCEASCISYALLACMPHLQVGASQAWSADAALVPGSAATPWVLTASCCSPRTTTATTMVRLQASLQPCLPCYSAAVLFRSPAAYLQDSKALWACKL